ncbi:hypothetical protein D0Z07_3765 [Hyphodiscus hymeniophilus]|uniref:Tat pathway signal sequence n=1 Tax=Hyphodiscus hymeniophilus TaxID=353542 RepID=A0A9P6VLD4_9HELO|nr:hypothetical protein D0Z07_3765 [Hyphodiscus hymeniophilus]
MPSQWLASMLSFNGRKRQQNYSQVADYRDSSSIDGEKGELLIQNRDSLSILSDERPARHRRSSSNIPIRLSVALNIALFCILVIVLLTTWSDLVLRWDKFDNGSLKRLSKPLFGANPPVTKLTMPGTGLRTSTPIKLNSAEVRANGYDPEEVAAWPEVYGSGPDSYVGRLDVFHKIHCIDVLRREARYDHYFGEKWPRDAGGPPRSHSIHVAHCIHVLLQDAMCDANTDPFVHYWVDVGEEPFPDFSVPKAM